MSFAAPQTPQKPALPGAYIQTPAQQTKPRTELVGQSNYQQHGSQGQGQALSQPTQQGGEGGASQNTAELSPIQRASRTINDTLAREAQFPELDSYVGRA